MTGASQLLEAGSPATAIILNPANPEARINLVAAELTAGARNYALLEQFARRGLMYNADDARLYSLLGIISAQKADEQGAVKLFASSLALAKAERFAGLQVLTRRAMAGDYRDAVERADSMLRRWPGSFPDAAPIFVAMAAQEGGYAAIFDKVRTNPPPPWRGRLIVALSEDERGHPALYRILTQLAKTQAPPTAQDVSLGLNAFLKYGEAAMAHRLFLLTLTSDERKRLGYVYNGSFTHPASGKAFDWRIQSGRGVEIAMPVENGGARLEFLDRPVTQIEFSQRTVLVPGSYRLHARVSGNGLSLPRGIFISLECAATGAQAARINIPDGLFRDTALHADFELPEARCGSQILSVNSGLKADVWSMRYTGTLTIHSISIGEPGSK